MPESLTHSSRFVRSAQAWVPGQAGNGRRRVVTLPEPNLTPLAAHPPNGYFILPLFMDAVAIR